MKQIEATRTIRYSPEVTFATARQITRYPEVMPNLDKVSIIADEGNGVTVSRWEATFSVGPLRKSIAWSERDAWNETELGCTFELVEGDMKAYNGTWAFMPDGDGCRIELKVNFELGIAMMGPMIDNIVNQLMQQNCDELLEAIEKLAGG